MSNIVKSSSSLSKYLSNAIRSDSIPKGLEWICGDCSGSMSTQIEGQGLSRIEAMNQAALATDDRVQWLGFSDFPHYRVDSEPFRVRGGTNFAPALRELIKHEPSYVIFMSDGEDFGPEETVLALCEQLGTTAVMDTLFIGGDNPKAESLMRRMAETCHGRFKHWDSTQKQQLSLTSVIQGLLPAPAGSDSGVIKL